MNRLLCLAIVFSFFGCDDGFDAVIQPPAPGYSGAVGSDREPSGYPTKPTPEPIPEPEPLPEPEIPQPLCSATEPQVLTRGFDTHNLMGSPSGFHFVTQGNWDELAESYTFNAEGQPISSSLLLNCGLSALTGTGDMLQKLFIDDNGTGYFAGNSVNNFACLTMIDSEGTVLRQSETQAADTLIGGASTSLGNYSLTTFDLTLADGSHWTQYAWVTPNITLDVPSFLEGTLDLHDSSALGTAALGDTLAYAISRYRPADDTHQYPGWHVSFLIHPMGAASEIRVEHPDNFDYPRALLADENNNSFVIVWQNYPDEEHPHGRNFISRILPNGVISNTHEIPAIIFSPVVTEKGFAAMAWGDNYDVKLILMDEIGNVREEIIIMSGGQPFSTLAYPRLAHSAGGNLLVVWGDVDGDMHFSSVHCDE